MSKAPDKKRKKRERRKEPLTLPVAPWEKGNEEELVIPAPVVIKTVKSNLLPKNKIAIPHQSDKSISTERFPFRIFSSMLFTAWLIFFVDQITKIAAQLFLLPRGQVSFGLIALQYTTNTGAAFGIFANTTVVLTILSFVAVQLLLFLLLIAYFFPKAPLAKPVTQFLAQPGHTALYTLLLGGAAGNLFDRLFRGYVIDFIEVPFFATFNIADCALSIAIGFLALEAVYQWWIENKNKQRKKS